MKELIIEGVLSIQAGENPHVVKEKIRTFRANWEEKMPHNTEQCQYYATGIPALI